VPATFVGQAVLLVEDNPVNRTIAEDMLARLGCSVFAVETGSAALAAECCARFTAIFLDLQLPDIDGFEVAQRLRARWAADEVTPVPIIALTANAFDSDRERCREAGMQGFVSKPCSEADLAHALAELAPA
jgi:CheY-like chemotaxis protein